MSTVEQQLKDFKLELGKEWLMLQTHKWRRPKWVKFPRSMLEDVRWHNLSPEAKALWIDVLMIATETADNSLPPTPILLNRLRILGNHYHISSVSRLIHELIQCGFLLNTTPELQSLRDTEIQSKKGKEGREGVSVESCGEDSTNIQIGGVGEEVKIEESKRPDKPDFIIGQPNLTAPIKPEFVPRAEDRSARPSYDELKAKYGENWGLGESRR